jgi:hypothetical protein
MLHKLTNNAVRKGQSGAYSIYCQCFVSTCKFKQLIINDIIGSERPFTPEHKRLKQNRLLLEPVLLIDLFSCGV